MPLPEADAGAEAQNSAAAAWGVLRRHLEGGTGGPSAGRLRAAAADAILAAEPRFALPAWLLQLFQVRLRTRQIRVPFHLAASPSRCHGCALSQARPCRHISASPSPRAVAFPCRACIEVLGLSLLAFAKVSTARQAVAESGAALCAALQVGDASRGMAGSAADPAALLRVFMRRGRLEDAARLALAHLRAWQTQVPLLALFPYWARCCRGASPWCAQPLG